MTRRNRTTLLSTMLALLLMTAGSAITASAPGQSSFRLQAGDLGIFGLSEADWEANGFSPESDIGDGFVEHSLQGSNDSIYYISFNDGFTVFLERQFVDGLKQYASVESFVVDNYLPLDAQLLDEYTGVLVDDSGERFTVQLYYSDSVYQQTQSTSGVVLVTYAGTDTSSVERVSLSLGT